ncbi:MAG TPA: AAA family ATPase [Acidimicrobiales bacterium]|nr:AAA family ATPase [Acidimicrobiales bacterium]
MTSTPPATPTHGAADLAAEMRARVGDVLAQVRAGVPALVVDSPPGAGKTGLVERLAVSEAVLHGRRVAIATTTRAQAVALAERLALWRGVSPVWLAPATAHRVAPRGVTVVTALGELAPGAGVTVGTAAKWAMSPDAAGAFDVLVVDEAYQLSFAAFAPIADLAPQVVMVGDPGQIAPVVDVAVERWRDDPAGPHRPAPSVLAARGGQWLSSLSLPATRRLPAQSAAVVSDAFYPAMAFGSLAPARTLRVPGVVDGESLSIRTAPDTNGGPYDPRLAAAAAGLVVRVLEAGRIEDEHGSQPVLPGQVGVVCAYVAQVPLVQAALGQAAGGVLVETANRWQGLERDVIVGLHPLSGQAVPPPFAMDAGRACVMCSRHKVAAVLVGSDGLDAAAAAGASAAERHFDDCADAAGAHERLLGHLLPAAQAL